ncbi:Long-chain-fatty-acid--CoA ligase [Rubripirellula lacrimiformis]|uniref:Long-chain-fatty-acid--CoA ligase n=1 Tax=Rubripirellula lacrimiformis TaxID=1930273 RepID=A0A517N925_9BACT|nr:AMP-binding protein [Rubripirellula lacrimiformis]QDT03634.1 Long-chain-fatty-acid--CoA ligase [Rubripirellula lacrimiformis]
MGFLFRTGSPGESSPQESSPQESSLGQTSVGIAADRETVDREAADREAADREANKREANERASGPRPTGITSYRDLPAYGVLQHAAEQIPTRPAIVYGDLVWNYGRLNYDSIRVAALLQRMGVRPGDRVGILLPNVPEYVIAANAIWRCAAVAIAISPLMVAEEISALLSRTKCRIVISLDMLSDVIVDPSIHRLLVSLRQHLPSLYQLGYLWARRTRTGHWTLPTGPRCQWLWQQVDRTTNRWQPITIDCANDPAYILPTGGTTGTPKAVTLSHTNLVANAWQQYQWTGCSFARETMLAVLPFFHSYGMSATVMGGAATGATLVLHHRFNTRQTIDLIEKHRPTVFHAVPAMLVAMNERFRKHRPDIHGLRWVISGGAPLEQEVASEFRDFTGALVVEGYGLSEASPVTHVGHLFRDPRYGVIGLPLPETECRIVDETDGDTEVSEGQVGELIIRGPQVMIGYWDDDAATAAAIRGGWLFTGDLAVQETEGYYRIVGRKKDLIITSGFNVYPSEVEDVIRGAPGVLDAAVVGVVDDHRGELVKAFVVMKPGAVWDESVLDGHCAMHLSKYKRPRRWQRCQDDLPRNFLGKVLRRNLRESDVSASVDEIKETM